MQGGAEVSKYRAEQGISAAMLCMQVSKQQNRIKSSRQPRLQRTPSMCTPQLASRDLCNAQQQHCTKKSAHLVATNSSSNPQDGWGFLEVVCICTLVHHAIQVLWLGRSDHPAYEAALHLGTRSIVVALRSLLTYYLHCSNTMLHD